MSETVLAAKLSLPPLPAALLQRERLISFLNRGLAPENRVILVCAPAGYGKTTLVSHWVHRLQAGSTADIAWLSLEDVDNDPFALFSALSAALHSVLPGIQETIGALLTSPQPVPQQAIAATLVNLLAGVEGPLVLILDDYHLIRSHAIYESVSFLIDHLPQNVHLAITTRSDPSLQLHRYRARGQLVEIRAADLRFTPDEVTPFIHLLAGIDLNSHETTLLEERTEGWAAGLQLAGISLRGQSDAGAFLSRLSGSQRYVLDYLAEEVYNHQPDEIQRFLLAASILDRFNAELCDFVLEIQDSRGILDELEKANLFMVPLDNVQYWYRYHHLFSDLLKARSRQALQDRELSPENLHRRAAAWFEDHGWGADAVQHAILAGDHAEAARMVERYTLAMFSQGELARLVGWVKLLPSDVADMRPRLKLSQAWATAFAGQIPETEALLTQVGQILDRPDLETADCEHLKTEAACIRGVAATMVGQSEKALELEKLSDAALQQLYPFSRSGVDWALGYAYRVRGDLPRASQAFEHMLNLAREHQLLWTQMTASVDFGATLRLQGKLRQAEQVFRSALAAAHQAGVGNLGYMGRLEAFLANILYEQNQLDAAEQMVLASITHNCSWQNTNHSVYAYLIYWKIAQANGEPAKAREALALAEQAAETGFLIPTLRVSLENARVRSWLAAGDLAQALRWVHDQTNRFSQTYDEAQEQVELTRTRILVAVEKKPEAHRLLTDLERDIRPLGVTNLLIEILILKALCAPSQADTLDALGRALELGLPEGYARVFLDEGAPMQALLQIYRVSAGCKPDIRIYLDGLLDQAGIHPSLETTGYQGQTLLTNRELEILKALARGLNNQQTGSELFISAGTVKAHTSAIYRKLDVANRVEAIARAKDLGLI